MIMKYNLIDANLTYMWRYNPLKLIGDVDLERLSVFLLKWSNFGDIDRKSKRLNGYRR